MSMYPLPPHWDSFSHRRHPSPDRYMCSRQWTHMDPSWSTGFPQQVSPGVVHLFGQMDDGECHGSTIIMLQGRASPPSLRAGCSSWMLCLRPVVLSPVQKAFQGTSGRANCLRTSGPTAHYTNIIFTQLMMCFHGWPSCRLQFPTQENIEEA